MGKDWKVINKIKQVDGTLYTYEHKKTGKQIEVFKKKTKNQKLRDAFKEFIGLD